MKEIIKKYIDNQDFKSFAAETAKFFKINSISSEIEKYLKSSKINSDCGYIDTFDKAFLNYFTYKKLFAKEDENLYPAIQIGGDGCGVDFWLDLASGSVISLHHDATFYEIGCNIRYFGSDFCSSFVAQGSQLTISQMIEFLTEVQNIPESVKIYENRCIEILKALKKSTNWDEKSFALKLDKIAMEFVRTKVGDFLEENGISRMSKAEKKISKILPDSKKLDLSDCFLIQLPSFENPEIIEEINLSNNACLILENELNALINLKKIKINNCNLSKVPKLPVSIQSIELNQNFIQNIDELDFLNQVKTIQFKENFVLPQEKLKEFQKKNPKCKITSELKSSNFDSVVLSYYGLNIKKLPDEILNYKNLKKLDLSGNPKLELEASLELLMPLANQIEELNLNGCGLTILPLNLAQFKSLKTITLFKESDRYKFEKFNSFCRDNGINSVLQTAQVLSELPNLETVNFDFFIGFGLPDVELAPLISKFQNAKKLVIKSFSHNQEINNNVVKSILDLPNLEEIHWVGWQNKTFNDEIFKENNFPNIKKIYWNSENQAMPNQFTNFINLEFLFSNGLSKKFFDHIDKFKNLKHLETITKYDKPVFPGKFGSLQNLETAQISNCIISTFENAFDQLFNLKSLIISSESSDSDKDLSFTSSVENLKSLEKFTIDSKYNKIEHLSDSFSKLKNLKELTLKYGHGWSNDDLPLTFPDNFYELENLEILTIEGNFNQFPASFSKIPNLKTLNIKLINNKDPFKFEKSFGNIKIEKLEIEGKFDFNAFEIALAEMKNLKSLEIKGRNWFEPRPFSEIVKTSNLENIKIYLDDMFNYSAVTSENLNGIAHFPNIKSLDFNYHKFKSAKELAQFIHLESLAIKITTNDSFEELLEIISNLKNLKELTIYSTDFKTLPEGFSKLTQIEKLKFSFHDSKTLGSSIYGLKNLKNIEFIICHNTKDKIKELKKNMPWVDTFIR